MLICQFGGTTREELLHYFEELPEPLMKFLERYNGGETPETSFSINGVSSDLVAFYGLGDVKYSYYDVELVTCGHDRYMPIAFDSFGNQIVCGLDSGKIGFLDHEKEPVPVILADDFRAFLHSVTSKKIDPKHTKSVEQREKEMIERGKGANITDGLRTLWKKEIEKYSALHQEEVVL